MQSPNVKYVDTTSTVVGSETTPGGCETFTVQPRCTRALFLTEARKKRSRIMPMSLGGNNFSTLMATGIANKYGLK